MLYESVVESGYLVLLLPFLVSYLKDQGGCSGDSNYVHIPANGKDKGNRGWFLEVI